jgi:hypothetical protein
MDELEKNPPSPEQKSKTREFLREWGFDVETFEARARRSMESTRGEVTGALRQTLTTTKQTLLDLQKSRQPVAAELKSGFERAWDEIEKAFAGARRQMRDTRESRETQTAGGGKKPTDGPPDASGG